MKQFLFAALLVSATPLLQAKTVTYRAVLDQAARNLHLPAKSPVFNGALAPGDKLQIVLAAPAGHRFRSQINSFSFRIGWNDAAGCKLNLFGSGQVSFAGLVGDAPDASDVELWGCQSNRVAKGLLLSHQPFSFRELVVTYQVKAGATGNFANATVSSFILGSGVSLEADAGTTNRPGVLVSQLLRRLPVYQNFDETFHSRATATARESLTNSRPQAARFTQPISKSPPPIKRIEDASGTASEVATNRLLKRPV